MKKFLPLLILAILSLARGTCAAQDYDLKVAGNFVYSQNASHITGPGIFGSVSFDLATRTLTLRNATIIYPATVNGILTNSHNLTINLIGQNRIECENPTVNYTYAICCSGDLTIKGTGSLQVHSNYTSIWCHNMIVEGGADIGISAKEYGIYGEGDCTVSNSTMQVRSTGYISIAGFNHMILNNVSFLNNTWYDEYGKFVVNASTNLIAPLAQIGITEYDLYVAGMRVNALNQNNINSVFSGTASYNPTTNTLTLRDVDINTPGNGIESSIDGLKLNLEGSNRIISQNASGIVFEKRFIVTGNGSLQIQGEKGFESTSQDNPQLTFENNGRVILDNNAIGIDAYYGTV